MIGYCGMCNNYIARPFEENICSKSGKVVPFLSKKDCYEERPTVAEKEETTMATEFLNTKVCKECGQERPISMFGGNHKSADGHLNTCKDCMSKKHRATSPKAKQIDAMMDTDKLEKESEANPLHFVENCLKSYKDEVLVKELRDRGWEVKCSKYVEL